MPREKPRRLIEQIAESKVKPGIYHGRLAEVYDGIGQYVLVSLSLGVATNAYKARVAAGDFGTGQRFPAGTPVTLSVRRGKIEILSLGNKRKWPLLDHEHPCCVQMPTPGTPGTPGTVHHKWSFQGSQSCDLHGGHAFQNGGIGTGLGDGYMNNFTIQTAPIQIVFTDRIPVTPSTTYRLDASIGNRGDHTGTIRLYVRHEGGEETEIGTTTGTGLNPVSGLFTTKSGDNLIMVIAHRVGTSSNQMYLGPVTISGLDGTPATPGTPGSHPDLVPIGDSGGSDGSGGGDTIGAPWPHSHRVYRDRPPTPNDDNTQDYVAAAGIVWVYLSADGTRVLGLFDLTDDSSGAARWVPRRETPVPDADEIEYDNTDSGLEAEDVKSAIDELAAREGGGGGGGGGSTHVHVVGEVPDGDLDGVNDEFDLAFEPAPPSTLALYLDGLRVSPSAYDLFLQRITFGAAPSGDELLADYLAGSDADPYQTQVFTADGTWDWAAAGEPDTVEVLVVGGGGGGGGYYSGGGGGGGGVKYDAAFAVSGDVAVVVGAGGAGGAASGPNVAAVGSDGGASSFGALAVSGGGGGGAAASSTHGGPGRNGASGGGGGGRGSFAGGTGVFGQGFAGGTARTGTTGGTGGGGGGGGGSEAGEAAGASNRGGHGGAGAEYPQFVAQGHFGWFAGGGGGGTISGAAVGNGGQGGGGAGGAGSGQPGSPAIANTGGGGGGGGNTGTSGTVGGAGADGVVIVRWLR